MRHDEAQHRQSVRLPQVGRQALGDHQDRLVMGNRVEQSRVGDRRSDGPHARGLGKQPAPQRDDVGQVDVVPADSRRRDDPVRPGVEPAAEMEYDAIRMAVEESQHPPVVRARSASRSARIESGRRLSRALPYRVTGAVCCVPVRLTSMAAATISRDPCRMPTGTGRRRPDCATGASARPTRRPPSPRAGGPSRTRAESPCAAQDRPATSRPPGRRR